MKKFTFNKNNVCENPNLYVVLPKQNSAVDFLTIRTFQKNGKWHGSILMIFNYFGMAGGDCKTAYDTEKEAYNAQKIDALRYIQQNISKEADRKEITNINEKFNHFPDSTQLSLF